MNDILDLTSGIGSVAITSNNQNRPRPKLYLNIGILTDEPLLDVDGNQREEFDGTPMFKFIKLPIGQGIDTMKPNELKGSQDWVKQMADGNALLKNMQKMAETIPAGSGKFLTIDPKTRLAVQLFHVSEQITEDDIEQDDTTDLVSGDLVGTIDLPIFSSK